MRIVWWVALFWLAAANTVLAAPLIYSDDPKTMTALEGKGYHFARIFGADDQSLGELYRSQPAWQAIVDLVGKDIADLRAEMKAGGRTLYEVTDGNVGRVMDIRWLKTEAARFRLVGIVNRLDRQDFARLRGEVGCGEVRFIYRLAYRFKAKDRTMASRMPFNLNAVYTAKPDADGGCAGVASRWTPGIEDTADAPWLMGGALAADGLTFKQLELNAQIVRFPSGQETEFGGQAAYLMRIFGIDGDAIAERPLENTPDNETLAADAALKAELAAYVRDNVPGVDLGVYEMPDKFLARKVISYSTFGSARLANHPFVPLFKPEDFAALPFDRMRLLKSPEALIERLDNGSCQGCHQAGSTAGFHFIGRDNSDSSPLNRIEVGISPHLHAEVARREAYVAAIAAGQEPNRFRQLSAAPPARWEAAAISYKPAKAAMPCMMPDEAAQFAEGWGCEAGLTCTPIVSAKGVRTKVAQCLLPPKSKVMFSGHPCLTGEIATNEERPFNDRMKITGQFAAFSTNIGNSAYNCRPPKIGVPGGLAYRSCNERDRTFADFKPGKPMPREICGLAGGKAFDICVATNDFDSCLDKAVVRGNRPSCDSDNFCREDYMCQSFTPDIPGLSKVKGIGFCSPTYFIFQMRIDNHPTPWSAERGPQ